LGGILTVKAHQTEQAVQVEISDTGCGIPPNDLKNIFEPFFTTKADKKSANETSGCGLGLTFCKKVVDVHNGSIKVESQPGSGTVFHLSIPSLAR
jgi:signal transduction histidine kinase